MKATDHKVLFARYLLLGTYGSGKTHAVGIMHEKLKKAGTKGIAMADFEQGFNTLKTHNFDVEVRSFLDVNKQVPTAFTSFVGWMTELEADHQGYGGLAIDSLTSLQAALMNYVISINPASRNEFGMATINDYGVLVNVMSQILPQLVALSTKMNVILTSHIRERENPVTGAVEMLPAITGRALPTQIGGWFNEIWKINILGFGESAERMAQTAGDAVINCKTQVKGMTFNEKVEDAIEKAFQAYGMYEERTHTEAQAITQAQAQTSGIVEVQPVEDIPVTEANKSMLGI